MDSRSMEMAALGRPLYPGMLYDCRRDTFIPGVTLWDEKAIHANLVEHPKPNTHLKVVASDNLSDKASLLDVSASLKASFLCGLVEVGGSAKYLNDTKSSARQCRVTMKYSQTSKYKQLTMTELSKITYPQVFEQKTATHVVTAALYGASAFMVFDYTKSENESKQAVEGNLHAVVKKIPTISIEGEAALKMNEQEKKLTENISVTFYGDLILKQNPTTYMEAVELYKMLPSLMNPENKDADVPVTVWLYPLELLEDKAARLVREINMNLLGEAETLLEELREVERRSNDLIENKISDHFPDLKERFLKFQALHRNYTRSFQEELSRVLPAIRSGAQEDRALQDILNTHDTSPFTANKMEEWLEEMTNELNILSSYTRGLEDLTVVKSPEELKSILFDPNVDVVVCLSFTSLKYEDSYLPALQDFQHSKEFTVAKQISEKKAARLTSPDISVRMKQNLSLFTSFSKANKNEKRIKFVIGSFSDPNNPGNSIQLHEKDLIDPNFQPVSKPPKPVVESSYKKVILKLTKSPTGETVCFRVEYSTTPPTDSAADVDAWTITETSDAESSFTLTELKPAEQYWVRYRAVSNVGVSEASDSVLFTYQGKRIVTVGQSWDFFMPSLYNKLRTKIMTNAGMSRWSLSTIKSEVTNVINSPNEPYTGKIPGGVKAGMAFYLQGVVLTEGHYFEIYLSSGTLEADDVIFYMLCDYGKTFFAYNIRRNGAWTDLAHSSACPIPKGSAFDIFIVTKTEGYEVYINGQKDYMFKHIMPMDKVNTLYIKGDIIMNIIGTVPNWSTSTFGKELNSGISRTKTSNIQSDVPHPVCSPLKPYFGEIPGGLRPGLALFFQGVVPSDCERFDVNLMTGPTPDHDIAFHFSPRMGSVVRNSRRNGRWENHEETPGGPFVKGGAFDIIMIITPKGYNVLVNGMEYCTFNHRFPVEKVTTLNIKKDVFMNTFGIIDVGEVNLKVSIPANI